MVSEAEYADYRKKNKRLIRDMFDGMGCRPVLFLGSGISKRYIGGPSWPELLKIVAVKADIPAERFTYLSQRASNNPITLGSLLADEIHQWAWEKGRGKFPSEYFVEGVDKSIFLKHLAAEHLKTLAAHDTSNSKHSKELKLLKHLTPHAIITTNFDGLLREMFPDYERILGEKIIQFSMHITGELYEIHGSVEQPGSLVLTQEDYERFLLKRKYISAKIMTYFAEYPVFIVGYGLGDTNVNNVISDLGEALKDKGGLLDNVFYVEWVSDVAGLHTLKEDYAIPVGDGSLPPLRLRTIVTSELEWVFQALADCTSTMPIQTKVLRQLAARVVELVRTDVPQSRVEVDYQHIEHLTNNGGELARVLGIGNVSSSNFDHPYLLTQVGKKLGFKGWHGAQKLIPAASEQVGFDIKSSDNDYHVCLKIGMNSYAHKYSESFVELLKSILSGPSAKESDAMAAIELDKELAD